MAVASMLHNSKTVDSIGVLFLHEVVSISLARFSFYNDLDVHREARMFSRIFYQYLVLYLRPFDHPTVKYL